MRFANIIIFHKNEASIDRLLKAMTHPDTDFYLHLDKKVNIEPYLYLGKNQNTYFVENRKNARWAGYSQVEAIINSLDQIIESKIPYDFVNLLSGQDYPIKPISHIIDVLSKNIGKSFMISETPPSPWWDEATVRFTKYHFSDYGFRGKYRLGDLVSSILPERKFPMEIQLYGGPYAAYWILSMDAAVYLHSLLSKKDKLYWFFKHTWAPDEFLFNTILMNSPFRDTIVNENYHYFSWEHGQSRPSILSVEDFLTLQQSLKFFARKFDPAVDEKILDLIDEQILKIDKQ